MNIETCKQYLPNYISVFQIIETQNTSAVLVFRTAKLHDTNMFSLKTIFKTIFIDKIYSPASLWPLLNTLTSSTWYLDHQQILAWSSRNSNSYINPIEVKRYRIVLSKLWFSVHIFRFSAYMLLFNHYDEVIENFKVVKPRFPYYFMDILQLMSTFTFYGYIACLTNSILCFLLIQSMDFQKYAKNLKMLKWFRLFLLIDAMLSSTSYRKTTQMYPQIRHISKRLFNKYVKIFRLANFITVQAIKGNSVVCLLAIVLTLVEVYLHPQWQYPFTATIFSSIFCVTWFYIDVAICQSLVLIFFLLCLFIVMQTESLIETIKNKLTYNFAWTKKDKISSKTCKLQVIERISYQYRSIYNSISEINTFWSSKYGFYCLFYFPTILTSFYLMLFVPLNWTLIFIASFVVIIMFTSFNTMSLTAGIIHRNSLKLHSQIYFNNLAFFQNLPLKDCFKVSQ